MMSVPEGAVRPVPQPVQLLGYLLLQTAPAHSDRIPGAQRGGRGRVAPAVLVEQYPSRGDGPQVQRPRRRGRRRGRGRVVMVGPLPVRVPVTPERGEGLVLVLHHHARHCGAPGQVVGGVGSGGVDVVVGHGVCCRFSGQHSLLLLLTLGKHLEVLEHVDFPTGAELGGRWGQWIVPYRSTGKRIII